MSRKQVECLICHKSMRADNLRRHKNSCKVQNKLETVMESTTSFLETTVRIVA